MEIHDKDFFEDDLKTMNFTGEVLNNIDIAGLGRIKVKVFGKFDNLVEDDIPWARPGNQYTEGLYSVPKVGTIVNIEFDNGSEYHPIYTYRNSVTQDLTDEIGEDVENFHSLIYDTVLEGGLKIFYSTNTDKGLILNLKDTIINVKNDNSVNILNPNGDSIVLSNDGKLNITLSDSITTNMKTKVENISDSLEVNTKKTTLNSDSETTIKSGKIDLGGGASEPLILGNKLNDLLDELLNAIGSMTVPTPTGPSGIPINIAQFKTVQSKLSTILSPQNKTL